MGKARESHSEGAKNSASLIKAELTAARDMALAKGARGDESARRARLSQDLEILNNQRAASQLFRDFAAKSGFDVDKFEQILTRNEAALRRVAEGEQAAAVKQSSAQWKRLLGEVAGRQEMIGKLGTLITPTDRIFVALDSPLFIWPTNDIDLHSSQITPWKSVAKFTLDTGRTSGFEEVGFYFLWENPSDRYAVVKVDGYLVFNGLCTATRGGGLTPGEQRFAFINVSGNLHLFEWWNQPPTQPLSQTDQNRAVLTAQVERGGYDDPGAIDVETVFRGVDLRFDLFLLPPHGVTVIEVAAAFSFGTGEDSGHVTAEFNRGDFQVMCPFVLIEVLS